MVDQPAAWDLSKRQVAFPIMANPHETGKLLNTSQLLQAM